MPKIKGTGIVTWIAILTLLLVGCYPDAADSIQEMELVATEHDVNYDFLSVQTYIMPDTVMTIIDPDDPDDKVPINRTADQLILDEVAGHFNEMGYQRLPNSSEGYPDVYITISAVATDYILNNGDNWWYFWGYYHYWPGWGEANYPWYTWGKPVFYGFSTGTVVITMLDVTGTDEEKIPVVWSATLNGLLKNTDADINQRIVRDIDQAFGQSSSYFEN